MSTSSMTASVNMWAVSPQIHPFFRFFSEQTKRFRTALMAVKYIKIKRDISRTFIKPSQEASQHDE